MCMFKEMIVSMHVGVHVCTVLNTILFFLDANTSFTPQSTHNLIKGLMLSNKEMHVPGWESK
jgi:hypothetical protein